MIAEKKMRRDEGSLETSDFKSDTTMKNVALIGAVGYIAPRHIKAIKETGNVPVVFWKQ